MLHIFVPGSTIVPWWYHSGYVADSDGLYLTPGTSVDVGFMIHFAF